MRTRSWSILGGVVCLCACMETPPPEAKAELAEPAAAAEVDRAIAPEDELPRPPGHDVGPCFEVPEGMRRVGVPLAHPLEHFESGDHVDLMFVAELRGKAIQREDDIAMMLVSNAEVACVREETLELWVFPAEAPLIAASGSYGSFYAVERAEGDPATRVGMRHVTRNRLMEDYISHRSEAPNSTDAPVRFHPSSHEGYGLEEFDAFTPGTVRYTLSLADPSRVMAGQRVDVILGTEVPSLREGSKSMEPAGIVFAQMAKVEEVGESSVSLLATPELALALAAADGEGTWSLSVRSFGDDEIMEYDDVRLKEHMNMLQVLGVQRERASRKTP